MPQPLRITLLLLSVIGVLGLIGYFFLRALRRSDDPARLVFHWIITAVLFGFLAFAAWKLRGSSAAVSLPFLCIVIAIALTVIWGRRIAHAFASPLTSLFDGGGEEAKPEPFYSIAEARRKQGKPREAMYVIQEQLAKFPGDFTGEMMLAKIQAEDINDLPGAELTIQRICSNPKQPPGNVAAALNLLADWRLKFDQDTDAARAALQQIVDRFPESELAHMAANRIGHLASREQLLAAHEPRKIQLKPGVEYLPRVTDQSKLLPPEKDFKVEAEELSRHLDQFPDDTEARERLAVIYAEDFGRLDFATEQLEHLISLPTESPRHIARWLNLLADLQVRSTKDTALARETLQRIVDRFPGTSFAELAMQRLMTLSLELHRYEKSRVVKLGSSAS